MGSITSYEKAYNDQEPVAELRAQQFLLFVFILVHSLEKVRIFYTKPCSVLKCKTSMTRNTSRLFDSRWLFTSSLRGSCSEQKYNIAQSVIRAIIKCTWAFWDSCLMPFYNLWECVQSPYSMLITEYYVTVQHHSFNLYKDKAMMLKAKMKTRIES